MKFNDFCYTRSKHKKVHDESKKDRLSVQSSGCNGYTKYWLKYYGRAEWIRTQHAYIGYCTLHDHGICYFISKSKHLLSVSMNGWLTIFLTLIGTVTLVDEIYFHKDEQSALAFVVIPLYQLFVFAIISFVVYLLAKRY